MSIIHVTNDLDEARHIADKICIVHHGKRLQLDTPLNVMTKPIGAEVAYQTGHANIFEGKILKHDKTQQKTPIQWCSYKLEAGYQPDFTVGSNIDWMIPAETLILQRRDRHSKGEKENPLQGKIDEFILLGQPSSLRIRVNNSDQLMHMSVPAHVARRNNLAVNESISISLLTEEVHLMEKEISKETS